MTKVWVSMTDKYMSGWGQAENRINKLVLECKDYNEAEIVANNMLSHKEMIYINICINKPRYNQDRYLTSYKTKLDCPLFYKGTEEYDKCNIADRPYHYDYATM